MAEVILEGVVKEIVEMKSKSGKAYKIIQIDQVNHSGLHDYVNIMSFNGVDVAVEDPVALRCNASADMDDKGNVKLSFRIFEKR